MEFQSMPMPYLDSILSETGALGKSAWENDAQCIVSNNALCGNVSASYGTAWVDFDHNIMISSLMQFFQAM
jgi:hypothetical protein